MTTLITEPTIKVIREIPDSEPSRDVLFEVTICRCQFLRRRSELKPLTGQILKGQT